MPVVFAQPDPVSPSLSAAAGYAQEFAALYPSMVHAALASRQNSGANAGAAYNQAQQWQYGQQNQAAAQSQALQAQADMQQSQQAATSSMIDQRSQNAVWEQQQQDLLAQSQVWTASDEMALQQAQNGLGQIQSDNGMSDPEKSLAASQYYLPQIQKMQQKKQYAQQQKGAIAFQEAQQEQAKQEQMAQIRAKSLDKRIVPVYDPVTGQLLAHAIQKSNGDWDYHKVDLPKEKGVDPLKVQAQNEAIMQHETAEGQKESKNWDDAYHRISESIRKQAQEHTKEKDASGNDKMTYSYPNLHDNPVVKGADGREQTVQDWNIEAQMHKQGYHIKKDDYLKHKAEERAALRGALSQNATGKPKPVSLDKDGKPVSGEAAEKPAEKPAASAARVQPEPSAESRPFKFADVTEKSPEAHRQVLDEFNQASTAVSQLYDKDRPAYDKAANMLAVYRGITEEHGAVPTDPDLRKRALDSLLLARRIADEARSRIRAQPNPASPAAAVAREWSGRY